MNKEPLISIIIPCYSDDRLNDIEELVNSLEEQIYKNIETIFVVEHSVKLHDWLRGCANSKPSLNMKVIFNQGEPGASASRNLGIKKASGNIIAFIDDDVVLFPDWAQQMVNTYLQGDSVIGVAGSVEPLWEDESMGWFPKELYWILGCTAWSGWNHGQEVRSGAGANMSFKREGLEVVGGFLASLGPQREKQKARTEGIAEDAELSIRIREKTGKPIIYNPTVKAIHKVHKYKLSLRWVTERSYGVGRSRRIMKQLYGQEDKSLLNPEHNLLKRIFAHLLPNILRGFLASPLIAWRKLWVTVVSLLFVAIGYYLPPFFNPFQHLGVPSWKHYGVEQK